MPMIRPGFLSSADHLELEACVRRQREDRGGSVCLNRFWAFLKWFSALVTPLPHLAVAD
mgnify:CR=1 FL=1